MGMKNHYLFIQKMINTVDQEATTKDQAEVDTKEAVMKEKAVTKEIKNILPDQEEIMNKNLLKLKFPMNLLLLHTLEIFPSKQPMMMSVVPSLSVVMLKMLISPKIVSLANPEDFVLSLFV